MRKIVAILFVSIPLLYSCENDIVEINKIYSAEDAQVEVGKKIELLYSTNGKIRARLLTPELLRHHTKDPFTEMPKGLKMYFFNDSMVSESKLSAKYGITYEKSNEMIVRDSVVVINLKGEKLETEELVWNEQTKKITSNKFVKIQTIDEIIYGDGIEANSDLTNYKIKKIRGTIRLKDNPLGENN